MNRLNRLVRQYHRKIALVSALPLLLTVLTGMAYTILVEWFQQGAIAPTILSLHNGEIFRLGGIYPILNGLGLLGLLATGLPMSSLFSKRRTQKEASDR
ncbi:peptidase [Trichocoleus sp. FACHB-591]|uniref:peptidase n=1 Tax=Trichocoleus sp. FACHB-591 TaxID=2692872 RepID=UPI001689B14E|nr:peptidase [Trichocoleus sp. FACHB-591]MBD2098827.1 peptidase [Trichocoleus sp. FACHB-591]